MEKFSNVVLYFMGAFGASRIDCREVTIERGVKYAQYNDAVVVVYLEKGKRKHKPRQLTLSYKPYLLVVDPKHAIPVPGQFIEIAGGHSTKWAACDERWATEWAQHSADMPVLLRIDGGAQ